VRPRWFCISPRPCRHPPANAVSKFAEAGALLGRPALFLRHMNASFSIWRVKLACGIGCQAPEAQGIPPATALNILCWDRLGLLIGRVVVSRILTKFRRPPLLWPRRSMSITTYGMLQTTTRQWQHHGLLRRRGHGSGLPDDARHGGARLPAHDRHRHGHRHHVGLDRPRRQPRIIGAIAGTDTTRIKTALLVLPAFSSIE